MIFRKILVVLPTQLEAAKITPLKQEVFVSGIGMVQSTFSLTQKLTREHYDFLLFAGIAGSFDIEKYPIGSVVEVSNEYFADMGIEINSDDYRFSSLFEENLLDVNTPPFKAAKLCNSYKINNISSVTGITVNSITTHKAKNNYFRMKYNAEIETMENGAYFYVAQQFRIPFLSLRTISNQVGDRDKSRWNIPTALSNLNDALLRTLVVISNT